MARSNGALVFSGQVRAIAPGFMKSPSRSVSSAILFRSGGCRVMGGLAVLDFAARQRSENPLDQLARGLGAQFHRHALATAFGLVDEIYAEGMIERRMKGVIIVDIGGVDP